MLVGILDGSNTFVFVYLIYIMLCYLRTVMSMPSKCARLLSDIAHCPKCPLKWTQLHCFSAHLTARLVPNQAPCSFPFWEFSTLYVLHGVADFLLNLLEIKQLMMLRDFRIKDWKQTHQIFIQKFLTRGFVQIQTPNCLFVLFSFLSIFTKFLMYDDLIFDEFICKYLIAHTVCYISLSQPKGHHLRMSKHNVVFQ